MRIKNLFFLAALAVSASATLTSCEDILGHWERPTGAAVTPSDSETPSEPEEEAVPGLLAGKFSVADGIQVQFSQGNLQAVIASGPTDTYNYTASSWKFAEHQWDYIGNDAGNTSFAAGSTVDLFGWVGTSASYDTYGLCTQTSANNAYYGTSTSDALKNDWGTKMGTGWRTLTKDEWTYLFNGRTSVTTRYCKATVNSKSGVVLFPDSYTHPAGVTAPASTNTANADYTTNNSWTSDDWTKMEAAGCVFLPAAGRRNGTSVDNADSGGDYWSSSPDGSSADNAYSMYFNSGSLGPAGYDIRYRGFSVRLVRPAE